MSQDQLPAVDSFSLVKIPTRADFEISPREEEIKRDEKISWHMSFLR